MIPDLLPVQTALAPPFAPTTFLEDESILVPPQEPDSCSSAWPPAVPPPFFSRTRTAGSSGEVILSFFVLREITAPFPSRAYPPRVRNTRPFSLPARTHLFIENEWSFPPGARSPPLSFGPRRQVRFFSPCRYGTQKIVLSSAGGW